MMHSTTNIGNNIRRIRRQRSLTQAELGRMIGMFPAPINNIENGKNLPSAKVLCKLANALRVNIDDFFQGDAADYTRKTSEPQNRTNTVCESIAPYIIGRKRDDLGGNHAVIAREIKEPTGIDSDTLDSLSKIADAVLALEDICGAQKRSDLPLNIPFDNSEAGLHELTDRIRQFLGISNAVVFDYLELLENAGLRVIFTPIIEKSLGCCDAINRNAFIFINSRDPVERQLFSLAYELGRIYIFNWTTDCATQTEQLLILRDYRGKPLTADRAARRFASLLLMPAQAVSKTARRLGISREDWSYDLVLRIKNRFGVSAESFLIRLEELQLITAPLKKQIHEQILAYYQDNNHAEPGGSTRVITPNARLGDLLLLAARHPTPELDTLRQTLYKLSFIKDQQT